MQPYSVDFLESFSEFRLLSSVTLRPQLNMLHTYSFFNNFLFNSRFLSHNCPVWGAYVDPCNLVPYRDYIAGFLRYLFDFFSFGSGFMHTS